GMVEDLKLLNQMGLAKFSIDGSIKRRHQRSLVFKVNGKLVLLDGNNRPEPTTWVIRAGNREGYSAIIKIQYRHSQFWGNCQVPIAPWTFTEMKHKAASNRYERYQNSEKKYRCGFAGRWYYARVGMLKRLDKIQGTDVEYWHKKRNKEAASPISEYLDRTCSWRSAYVPAGRSRTTGEGIDGKTWREIECAAMGISMILEADRDYHIPLVPYEHYIPVANQDSLEKAVEMVLEDKELGIRGRQWYDAAASPMGICRTFLEVLEKLGIL
ncbi:hypothetical protein LCGC14_2448010, partial [marine sediment metagenome]